MRPSEILALGWSQCTYAIDAEGREVDPLAEEAMCFCYLGAARRAFGYASHAAPGPSERQYIKFIEMTHTALREVHGYHGGPGAWQDWPGRTAAEVIGLAQEVERRLALLEVA